MEFSTYDVTCHTKKCENAEITIRIEAPTVDPNVICGVCNKQITDVVLVPAE